MSSVQLFEIKASISTEKSSKVSVKIDEPAQFRDEEFAALMLHLRFASNEKFACVKMRFAIMVRDVPESGIALHVKVLPLLPVRVICISGVGTLENIPNSTL